MDLAGGCDKLTPEEALTVSQIASLKPMGLHCEEYREVEFRRNDRVCASKREMAQMSKWTPAPTRNAAVWERNDDGSKLIPTRGAPQSASAMGYSYSQDSKTIRIMFSDGEDKLCKKIAGHASGENPLACFGCIVFEAGEEDRIAQLLGNCNPEEGPYITSGRVLTCPTQ